MDLPSMQLPTLNTNHYYGKPLYISDVYQPVQASDVANIFLTKENIDRTRTLNRISELELGEKQDSQAMREAVGKTIFDSAGAGSQPPSTTNPPQTIPNAPAPLNQSFPDDGGYVAPGTTPPTLAPQPEVQGERNVFQPGAGEQAATPATPQPTIPTPYGPMSVESVRNLWQQNPKATGRMLADWQQSQNAAAVAEATARRKWEMETWRGDVKEAIVKNEDKMLQALLRAGQLSDNPMIQKMAGDLLKSGAKVSGAEKLKTVTPPITESYKASMIAKYPDQADMFKDLPIGGVFEVEIGKGGTPVSVMPHKIENLPKVDYRGRTASGDAVVFNHNTQQVEVGGKKYTGAYTPKEDEGEIGEIRREGLELRKQMAADAKSRKEREDFDRVMSQMQKDVQRLDTTAADVTKNMPPAEYRRQMQGLKARYNPRLEPFRASGLWKGWDETPEAPLSTGTPVASSTVSSTPSHRVVDTLPDPSTLPNGSVARDPSTNVILHKVVNGKWVDVGGRRGK